MLNFFFFLYDKIGLQNISCYDTKANIPISIRRFHSYDLTRGISRNFFQKVIMSYVIT